MRNSVIVEHFEPLPLFGLEPSLGRWSVAVGLLTCHSEIKILNAFHNLM